MNMGVTFSLASDAQNADSYGRPRELFGFSAPSSTLDTRGFCACVCECDRS